MKLKHIEILCCCMMLLVLSPRVVVGRNGPDAKELKEYLSNLPFTMPIMNEPVFPDHRVNIVEHGAIADGKTLNTKAIQDAISDCSKSGGGTVVVPPGTWMTGPIELESNVNLHLESGALLQFSSRYEDFPLIRGVDGKSKRYEIAPPIHGYRLTNVAITGDGVIDGAGEAWRPIKKEKQTANQWKALTASAGVVTPDGKMWWPSKEAMDAEQAIKTFGGGKEPAMEDYAKLREFLRPDLFKLVQCNGILLDGPTFRNSPRYHLHPTQSENIIIRNTKVQTPWYAQNGDGIDLSSCRNVVIYKSTVDVGDDGICMKPGKISSNQTPGPACANIVIADCIVYHAHGGFVIGSESNGGAHNISVKNCTYIGTDIGLRFKSRREHGGLVDSIYIEGIQMRDIATEAISFDMYYGGGGPDETAYDGKEDNTVVPVNELTPQFRDIFIKNIVCKGANRALLINGLPEMPIKTIHFENVRLEARKGAMFVDADSIMLKNVDIALREGPVFLVNQSKNILLDGLTYPKGADLFLSVDGEKTSNINLGNVDLSNAKKDIEFGQKVKHESVIRK